MSESVFHVELRQFPNVARAFNLTREELEARFVAPWRGGRPVELDDRRWTPEKARLTVYEGRPLAPAEIGMGRGWANATRTGRDVTDALLEAPSAVDLFTAELPPRITLAALVERAGVRYPGSRVSERIALAEQAVWQLLHANRARLIRDGRALDRAQWGDVILTWEAWTDSELWLESGYDVGDQPLSL